MTVDAHPGPAVTARRQARISGFVYVVPYRLRGHAEQSGKHSDKQYHRAYAGGPITGDGVKSCSCAEHEYIKKECIWVAIFLNLRKMNLNEHKIIH